MIRTMKQLTARRTRITKGVITPRKQAVGKYLKTLREHLGKTQLDARDRLGVSVQTISRWEVGEHEPRSSLLDGYIAYVQGHMDDIHALHGLKNPTARDGEKMAEDRIRKNEEKEKQQILAHYSKEELEAIYEGLKTDQSFYDTVRGIWEIVKR
jgi:transcriptional regulator with XRE-family HTH domain